MKNKDIIVDFLLDLKYEWKPKTKKETGYGYHGSSKGDEIEYTLYFDEYNSNWTTKDMAFRGFVFKKISQLI